MGIRRRTKKEIAAIQAKRKITPPPKRSTVRKRRAQERAQVKALNNPAFGTAKTKGKGIYTEKQKKQILTTRAMNKAYRKKRQEAIRSKRSKK